MKGICVVLLITLVMAVNASTPVDVVKNARESPKPLISTNWINASVFETEPFAKDTKRTSPLSAKSGKNFTGSLADESLISESAEKEWAVDVPKLPESTTKESFRRNNTGAVILGPVIESVTIPSSYSNNSSLDVLSFLNPQNQTTNGSRLDVLNFLNS